MLCINLQDYFHEGEDFGIEMNCNPLLYPHTLVEFRFWEEGIEKTIQIMSVMYNHHVYLME